MHYELIIKKRYEKDVIIIVIDDFWSGGKCAEGWSCA